MKLRTLTLPCAAALLASACASSKPAPAAAAPQETTAGAPAAADASTEAHLREILAMPLRSDDERHRDQYRHPIETLTFFGLREDQRVVELSPGGGWYTRILGPFLAAKGHLVTVSADPEGKPGNQRDGAVKLRDMIKANHDAFASTEATVMAPPARLELGPDGSADAVVTFRNLHNWAQAGTIDAVLAASFKALKPGGVFGVEDHRADPKTPLDKAMEGGYLPEAYVIERAQAAGFKLVAKSEVNANPKDTKDYVNGVWSLPPTLAGKDVDKDKFLAIGESDRMTLKFEKPAK